MEKNRKYLLILALATEGGMAVCALVLAAFFQIDLQWSSGNPILDIISGVLSAVPPFLIFLFVISKPGGKYGVCNSLRKTLLEDCRPLFSQLSVLDILFISLLAGLGEELLFRGILQYKLGLIIASIAFGLVHFISPAYILIAALIGVYIGLIYEYSQNLMTPVVMHFIYDFAALICLKHKYRSL
ncbi:CPBP family intramembrane metalloprotease [bacterium]|nr:CPBP family intramembrane metalloprotease [bacterium]